MRSCAWNKSIIPDDDDDDGDGKVSFPSCHQPSPMFLLVLRYREIINYLKGTCTLHTTCLTFPMCNEHSLLLFLLYIR